MLLAGGLGLSVALAWQVLREIQLASPSNPSGVRPSPWIAATPWLLLAGGSLISVLGFALIRTRRAADSDTPPPTDEASSTLTAGACGAPSPDERALRHAEARFCCAFDDASIGMVILESDWRIVRANESLGQMLGYGAAALAGLNLLDLFNPADRSALLEALPTLAEQDVPAPRRTVEKRLQHRDGRVVWARTSLAVVPEEGGRPRFLTAQIEDTTERRRAGELLRHNTEQLRACIENTPNVAVQWYDREGRVVFWNRASETLTGWSAEEALGLTPEKIFRTGQSAAEFVAILRDLEKTGETLGPFELGFSHRDGTPRSCLSTLFAIPTAGGDPQFVCMDVDMTAATRATQALAQSEERLRAIVETIEEVFWTAEPGGIQATYISPAVSKVWGYPPERFLQNPSCVLETIHPDDRATFLAAVDRQAQGQRTSIEYRVFHADGSIRWIWDQGFPVLDASGRLIAINGLATNITERRRLETELRQAQKMEAIGTLAGGIAHDFNNILGSIMGFSELARLDAKGNAAAEQSLHEVLRASRRAKALVQQILAFSRRDEAGREPVLLGPITREAIQLLRAAAPASIRLDLRIPHELPAVLADPTQLHQVVMNLGTNAIHAIRPGHGAVELRLERIEITPEEAAVHRGLNTGPHVRLTVADSGAGIAPAALEHIFEPFFTTKAPGEGSGLGLSVVHGIVNSHGGVVTVESQPGVGTTVQVYLPALGSPPPEEAVTSRSLSSAPSSPSAASSSVQDQRAGGGEHVLFVDDEPSLVQVGKRVLEECGYRVTTKNDPVAAWDEFRRRPDDFDLVITDLTMPNLDGAGLALQILQLRPAMPVLLTTGFGASVTREQALRLGIRDLLFKPTDPATLGDAVHRALDVSK
jgi:PAS domain S-box-containing protein